MSKSPFWQSAESNRAIRTARHTIEASQAAATAALEATLAERRRDLLRMLRRIEKDPVQASEQAELVAAVREWLRRDTAR